MIDSVIDIEIDEMPCVDVDVGDITVGGNNRAADYEELENKPQINEVTLIGNKSFDDLGLSALTSLEIIEMYRRIINNAE